MIVSAIIPVLNEAATIATAVHRAWQAGVDEVIVVDGGSTDDTRVIAEQLDCQMAQSQKGRGQQMNAGAQIAQGDVLWFLHADNWAEQGAAQQIRDLLNNSQVTGGGFRQQIDHAGWIYRAIESGNYWRARVQGLVYGDQGLFVRRSAFEDVGGFPDIPLMEDFRLSQVLFKTNRPVMLPGPLHVCSRRWERNGPLKQTWINWRLAMLYRCGVKPESLYRRYYQ